MGTDSMFEVDEHASSRLDIVICVMRSELMVSGASDVIGDT